MNSQTRYVLHRVFAVAARLTALIISCFGILLTQTSFAASSNEKVVIQGRIVDPSGVAVADNNVNFDISIYTPTTGVAGSHCLLYRETQNGIDMSTSAGTFVLQIGDGTRVGTGPTLRETFTNASVASFSSLTCGVGSAYTPGAIDDRSIEITVSFASQVLTLAAIPVKAVPYAFQANQIGGYGINNLVRLNGAGSTTNLNVDQFNYLTGFYHDNSTSGVYTDDYLDAQNLQIKNLAAPTANNDAATKTYVDTAISGVSAALPALADTKIWVGNSSNVAVAVSMSGDASIDDTGKLTVTGIQGKAVTLTGLASSDTLVYNGTAWVNKNMPTCTAGQYLSFNGTTYSCAAPSGVSPTGSALTAGQIWVGNVSNLAAPVAMSGDATISNTGTLTLASVATAGTYSQVTVNAKGLVTSGTSPTTLAGYGITDAIKNAGGTPSVYSGATQPATPATGDLYVDTANKKWQRYNGATWDDLGTAGALTDVTASSPLQSSGGTTPAISFVNQNANLVLAGPTTGVAAAPTFRSLVAADLPTLTAANLPALTAANFWLGNASNGTAAVAMSGDATMDSTGKVSVTGIQGKTIDTSSLASGQVLQYNGSTWVPSTISTSPTGAALNSGLIWVGNASNAAAPVALSGDIASVSATGVVALNTIPVTEGGTGETTWALGQIPYYNGTKLTGLTCTTGQSLIWDVANGFVCGSPSASGSSLGDGKVWIGNGSGVAMAVTPTGDVSISNAGATLVNKLQGTAVSATAPTVTGQVLQYNGTNWGPGTLNFMSPTLTANNVWLGNASNIASPIAVPTCAANNYLTFDGTSFSCALDAGATGSVTSLATTAPLATTGSTGNLTLSMGLTSAHVYVGNASNLATDVALSGDATISNTGALTLASVATAGTYSQVTVNAKGLVTSGTSPTTLAGYGITDAIKNAGGTPSVYSGATQPATPATGDLYVDTANKKWQRYNGATWDDLGTAGALTDVTASSPLQSSGGTTPAISFANQNANLVLAGPTTGVAAAPTFRSLVAADLPTLTAANLPALNSGLIWVGNASNAAEAVTPTGDVSISNAGATLVNKLQGTAVSATAPTVTGQVLQYNGTNWGPGTLNFMSPTLTANNVWLGNASNIASPIAVPTCAANNYLTFDGTSFSCALDAGATGSVTSLATTAPLATTGSTGALTLSMGLTSGHIYVGNASNLAADVAMSGDATISNTGALTLASVATAGTYSQVTVNAKGLVTSGTSPTTLAGYGITDAIKNAGGTPSVYSGATQPATPATGDLYVDTANKKWQRYNGATWDDLGTAGALTDVTASSPLQSSGGTTPAISFANQAQNSVLAGPTSGTGAPTFRSLVAADLPTLTAANLPALAAGTFWLGNASGVTAAQSMSGDASMTGAGLVSVTGIQGKSVDATAPTSGQILQYNGSKWAPTTSTNLSSTLTNGHIFMGNSSGVAVDTTLSGDVTFTGGATKVTALQNFTVAATTPTSNQVLQFNGTAWAPATFSGGTTISGGTQNHLAKFNAAGTNVVDSSVTDDGTYVQVTKVFRGPASFSNASTSIDFSKGNIQYTSSSCGAMTLTNMKDGATYTLAVQGTSVGTCVFTAYSDSGSTSVSVLYPPDFGATTATYQTLFSFVVVNSTAYLTWIPGYHP